MAYVILVTFFLDLGDWPFVDEIFAEQAQQESTQLAQKPSLQSVEKMTGSNGTGSIYQTLTDLVDMPLHLPPLSKTLVANFEYFNWDTQFVSVDQFPSERPPLRFLS